MALHNYYQGLTVSGSVVDVDPQRRMFRVQARSGDLFETFVGPETYYEVVRNLDSIDRDRVGEPDGVDGGQDVVLYRLVKYVTRGRAVAVSGVYQENGDRSRFEARTVRLLHSDVGRYIFEETHWWISQTMQMADRILDHLFDARRSYTIDDFSKFYRTQLNIMGQPVDDTTQECAVLSRLLYDLSSAYLLTGAERYYLAAKAAADYIREAFRSLSHDGQYCFWAFGRRRTTQGEKGEFLAIASEGPDDRGTFALYEQIYALAGLTQFYRITLDWELLEDIRRTINTFQAFYHDAPECASKPGFTGKGGYFSHIDPVTMRPDVAQLGENRSQKNWNSVGDHIPAYLINLILTLDPLPEGDGREVLESLLHRCWGILEETSTLIVERFPDPDPKIDYVRERFTADWTPIDNYRWQRDRAVVGHNLKIAWNLTRCAFYFQLRAWRFRNSKKIAEAEAYEQRAEKALALARRLGDRMGEVGLDKIRGGVFDCVERTPDNDMPTQFAWEATKDFWQQEQGILAYLILHGATPDNKKFLELGRECSTFWNTFFLDHERQGYFFRVTENGLPVLHGEYGRKSGHAIGYHAFELAYLAHVYTRTFVAAGTEADNGFCLYFKVGPSDAQRSINVLPDFMPPGAVEIARVRANGLDVTEDRRPDNPNDFQISLAGLKGDGDGRIELAVEFRALAPQA